MFLGPVHSFVRVTAPVKRASELGAMGMHPATHPWFPFRESGLLATPQVSFQGNPQIHSLPFPLAPSQFNGTPAAPSPGLGF